MTAREWFEKNGGLRHAIESTPSEEAKKAWGVKYPGALLIQQVGMVVTLDQAEQYAREFAAEQLETIAYKLTLGGRVAIGELRSRAAELRKGCHPGDGESTMEMRP